MNAQDTKAMAWHVVNAEVLISAKRALLQTSETPIPFQSELILQIARAEGRCAGIREVAQGLGNLEALEKLVQIEHNRRNRYRNRTGEQ